MPIVPVTPSGQVRAGAQYSGLRPALAVSQHAGQVPLVGSEPDENEPEPEPYVPARDPRKCGHEDGCGGWRQKDSEQGLCAGHERAYKKALRIEQENHGPTGDEGLR